jgi:sugar lactone lactonase YvrE
MKTAKTTKVICCVLGLTFAVTSMVVPAMARHKKHAHIDIHRVWPPPPQKARYKLLQIIGGEADIVKKKSSLVDRLIAEDSGPTYIHFQRPHGVTGDRHGKLYVTDTYWRRLFVIDPVQRTFKIFGAGNPDVHLKQPLAVEVDSQDRVWVADSSAHAVFCFDPDEKLLFTLGVDPGTGAEKAPTLERPSGIALDEKRQRVYIADAKLDQIFVYDLNGTYLAKFGEKGMQPGQLMSPGQLALDPAGNLYVADTLNARVQMFDPEFNLIKVIGKRGDRVGQFERPTGVALDSDGHLYVTDSWFHNMQIFGHDPRRKPPNDFDVLLFIGGGGRGPGQLLGPGEIYINSYNQIFVADQLNGRIQVFQYLGGDEKSSTNANAQAVQH